MKLDRDLTAKIDAETLAGLERLAARFDCTVEHLVTTAILRFIDDESRDVPEVIANLPPYFSPDPLTRALDEAQARHAEAFRAFIQPGLDAADRGDLIPHEEVFDRIRARRGRHSHAAE